MSISQQQVMEALGGVLDPELQRDLVTLNMVRHVSIDGGVVRLQLKVSSLHESLKSELRSRVTAALRGIEAGVEGVEIEFTTGLAQGGGGESKPKQPESEGVDLPGVKHIIAVGAGKGGVGKSTVSVNLAVGLARQGAKVGILDGDIYGPSLPTMMGLDRFEAKAEGKHLLPFEVHGVKAMSLGSLVEDEKPLIWRGPMAHGAFRQLISQTLWGDLDYLIIDLPPGTGDVPLTMAQLLPLTGAVVVCTPQKVAQDDARRAVAMFRQMRIEVLGVVENMSYFIGDDGKEYDIFGKGGAELMAQQSGIPFLGRIPINTALRYNADAGDPSANFTGDDALARDLSELSRGLVSQVSMHLMSEAADRPTLNVT
ncbi:Mrp/NBP35 family ATP-binding protein [Mucisphaera calidilacus]|uniref:Iron-sulfur cluster carrier protein n=1 Tax=Mucisphaera calidilacus TaxID=2527982 RepID=A0A518BWN2_9BACT|nr:Mrp/NBP35 family ATP-binding protein [Mucisphaera calidilacus]QDU71385.1 Septum site-determining protein MinD [Mucisphaera calidilacus]